MTAPAGGVLLGFDYGQRRIGVAVGDTLTGHARPLPALVNGRSLDWQAIERLVREWHPRECVVGLPLDLAGNDQPITIQARGFAEQLRSRLRLTVHLCDERLTSRAADDELRNARASGRLNRRVRSGERDGVAARLILEQWMADHSGAGPHDAARRPLA